VHFFFLNGDNLESDCLEYYPQLFGIQSDTFELLRASVEFEIIEHFSENLRPSIFPWNQFFEGDLRY